jgi:NAD+ kinase
VRVLFKTVGIVARYDKEKAIKLAEELGRYLQGKGLQVCVENTLTRIVKTGEMTPLERMKTDLIITIGGDGTILRTCVSTPKPEPPILAINMGIRGFLTEVEPKQAFIALDKCLNGDYRIEKCMKLAAGVDDSKFPDALNEVLITHDEPAKLLYTRILKDGDPILTCQADSLLISTQTGSTGYSLSAGGPVLDPCVNAFVLTPICPLTDFRPVVFPANSNLTIEVLRPNKILVLIDGQFNRLISSRHPTVTVTRSKNETSFVRFTDNFYDRLRSRLLFKGMR